MKEDAIIVRKYRESDAGELLRMWKESQCGWPAGMSLCSGNSPEQFHRNLSQGAELVNFVAEDESQKRIVGYCSFAEDPSDGRFSDLPLLNVHPGWQKQGIGRRLILAVVRESTRRGYQRLDLGTWPGNINAVGLYKKCGFCWIPGTSIQMVNHIPLILNASCLKNILNGRNWYSSLQIGQSTEPDDHSIGKMRVFEYRFKLKDQDISVWVDRESNSICGFETDRIKMIFRTDDSEACRGFNRNLSFTMINKSRGRMEGKLQFEGCRGFEFLHQESFGLAGEETFCLDRQIEIPGTLMNPKKGPGPEVAVRVKTNGYDCEFKLGFKFVLPVSYTLFMDDWIIPTHRQVTRIINAKNRMDKALDLHLTFKCSKALSVQPKSWDIVLPPRSTQGIPVQVLSESGNVDLTVCSSQASGQPRDLPEVAINMAGRAFGETGWVETDDYILIRNDFLQVIAMKNTGMILIQDLSSVPRGLVVQKLQAGPPFGFGPDFEQPSIRVSRENNSTKMKLTTACPNFTGAYRETELAIDTSPLIKMSSRIFCEDNPVIIPCVRQVISLGSIVRHVFIPTQDGVLEPLNERFPFGTEDLPHDPGYYPESWIANDFGDCISGVIWAANPSEIIISDWKLLTLDHHDIRVSKNQAHLLPDKYIYLGPGCYRTVQNLWSQITDNQPGLKPQPVMGIDQDGLPWMVRGSESVHFEFKNRRSELETGTLKVHELPVAGLKARIIPVSGLNNKSAVDVTLKFDSQVRHPAPATARMDFETASERMEFRVPLILFPELGSASKMIRARREDYKLFHMEQQPLAFEAVPDFHGTLVSLKYCDKELLRSPFPKTGILGFESPWYGGVTPEIRKKREGELKILWIGRSITRRDHQGRKWRGIGLESSISEDDDIQGLKLGMEYLSLTGHAIMACRLILENAGTAAMELVASLIVFPGMDGRPPIETAYHRRGRIGRRYLSENRSVICHETWAAFRLDGSNLNLAAVNGRDSFMLNSLVLDVGTEGSYLYQGDLTVLKPGQVSKITLFLVPFEGELDVAAGLSSLSRIRFA